MGFHRDAQVVEDHALPLLLVVVAHRDSIVEESGQLAGEGVANAHRARQPVQVQFVAVPVLHEVVELQGLLEGEVLRARDRRVLVGTKLKLHREQHGQRGALLTEYGDSVNSTSRRETPTDLGSYEWPCVLSHHFSL